MRTSVCLPNDVHYSREFFQDITNSYLMYQIYCPCIVHKGMRAQKGDNCIINGKRKYNQACVTSITNILFTASP